MVKTITVGEGQTFNIHVLDAEGGQSGSGTFKHKTDATTTSTNAMTVGAYDATTTDADVDVDTAGLTFTVNDCLRCFVYDKFSGTCWC